MLYFLLVVGFLLLIKGADWLVDGASSIAKRLRVSDLVIGLTIVAFGTSAPELVVNLFASVQGNTELAIGNILGSNSANILLILGISAIVYPLAVTRGTIWKEIPFSLLAVVLVAIMANDILVDGGIANALTRSDGLTLLGFFLIFLYYTFSIAKDGSEKEKVTKPKYSWAAAAGLVGAGLVALIIGGKWIVDGAVAIASMFGVSESLIGLTIVAVGTSLPELATSVVAAYKKKPDIAVGNVVGSNIFNIFFILGISSIVNPLSFSAASNFDIGMVVFATVLLFIWMFVGRARTIDRWQGMAMIASYAAYIVFLVVRG